MADAEKAMKSTENMKIRKRDIRAEFCQKQKSDLGEGVFTFTYLLPCLLIERQMQPSCRKCCRGLDRCSKTSFFISESPLYSAQGAPFNFTFVVL